LVDRQRQPRSEPDCGRRDRSDRNGDAGEKQRRLPSRGHCAAGQGGDEQQG
jgi:hypothetical protein